jgi:WhiB family redox-sensing transcriptional regulator
VAIRMREWLQEERPWAAFAACRDSDPALFFPTAEGEDAAARRICAGCAVRDECLEWALTVHASFGVWGGTNEQERRRLVRRSA